jgi:uncharacterized protein (UPF0371 family)
MQASGDAEAVGKGNNGMSCGAAIELMDGTIITGKNSPLMHSASALVLNPAKHLAGLPDPVHLLPPIVIASLSQFRRDVLHGKVLSLDLEETRITLSISAALDPAAQLAIEKLRKLRGCEMHLTHAPPRDTRLGSGNSESTSPAILSSARISSFRVWTAPPPGLKP